jgi:hypothetical protein
VNRENVPTIRKTSFQDEISFRFDLLGGELLTKITRELSKTRKLLPNISNDQQSKAWMWRGTGAAGDPYYWVKVSATDIVTFTGFFAGAENWSKFRRDVRDALLDSLSGVETDFVANLTAIYGWIVPITEVGKLREFLRFSHSVLPEDLEVPERFSTLLSSTTSKQRAFFEGAVEGPDEFRLSLSVQTNRIENSLAKVFDEHFASTDAAYLKANSFIESVFEK